MPLKNPFLSVESQDLAPLHKLFMKLMVVDAGIFRTLELLLSRLVLDLFALEGIPSTNVKLDCVEIG